jgi:hypothetical protein
MYWGAAAAVVLAVVIMLLTQSPAPRRTVVAEAVAPAAKNALSRDVVPVNKGGIEPPGGAAGSSVVQALENTTITPMSSEQIVLPSSNPRTAYFNAAAVAAKGGWLPAELQKEGAVSDQLKAAEADQVGHPAQVLQFTLRMKRDQVPLLKDALAAAGLPAAAENGGRGEELKEADESAALRATYARTAPDETPMSGIVAAAPPAPAGTEAAKSLGGAAAVSRPQPVAEKAVQRTEAATPLFEARKVETAEEPLVQVTLLFPLAESPVPAAPPAAGAADSVTPDVRLQHGGTEDTEKH